MPSVQRLIEIIETMRLVRLMGNKGVNAAVLVPLHSSIYFRIGESSSKNWMNWLGSVAHVICPPASQASWGLQVIGSKWR